MQDNFTACLDVTLAWEGGYSDHPDDPGGETFRGVTQATYSAWRERKGLPPANVAAAKKSEINEIYRSQYWNAVRANDLPAGVDLAVFDYAVNSGPGRAARDLQRVLGVTVDGIVGEKTIAAARQAVAANVVEALCRRRLAFCKRLKTWKTFGRGWTRRIMGDDPGVQDGDIGIIDQASKMAFGLSSELAKTPSTGKADPADTDVAKTPEGVTSGVSVIGVVGTLLSEAAGKIEPLIGYSEVVQWVFVGLTLLGVSATLYVTVSKAKEGTA